MQITQDETLVSHVKKTFRSLFSGLIHFILSLNPFMRSNTGLEHFIAMKDNDSYIKYLQYSVWSFDEKASLYFLFLNPIFVFCSFSMGFEIILIDFVILVLLDMIIEKSRAQVVGERLVHSVLNFEQKKSDNMQRQKRLQNGKLLSNYFRMQKLQPKRETD